MKEFPIMPEVASSFAWQVDLLYYFLSIVTIVMTAGIYLAVFYFAVRYRDRGDGRLPADVHGNTFLEIFWSVTPLVFVLIMFFWGTVLYFHMAKAPDNSIEMFVVGKQWMWKIQHPNGRREINEIHLPLGQPVRLTMASEDVLHSFFIPAFRAKQDVVPGRYATLWFEPTKVGEYHLFCAEYCGTQHSGMIGRAYVMEPRDYEAWLAGQTQESPVEAGRRLFETYNCANCHEGENQRGPSLLGQFGKNVNLEGGQQVLFDEAYIRESMMTPMARVVSGFRPVMPTFRGQISEEDILRLISYIKSLTPPAAPAATAPSAPAGAGERR